MGSDSTGKLRPEQLSKQMIHRALGVSYSSRFSPGSLNVAILTVCCDEPLIGDLIAEKKHRHVPTYGKVKARNAAAQANQVEGPLLCQVLTLLGCTLAASILARKSVGENLNSFCR